MKPKLRNFILLSASILFSIVLIEAVLFLADLPCFYKLHTHPPQFSFLRLSKDKFLHLNLPSERIRFEYDGNPRGYFGIKNEVDHWTNSWGFRGEEFTYAKQEGVFRVAFLGDSFTFGEGVRFVDTYAEQALSLLRKKHRGCGIAFQGYNFGVGGYNTSQVLLLFKNRVLGVEPDAVVIKNSIDDAEPSLYELDVERDAVVRVPRWYEEPGNTLQSRPPQGGVFRLRFARLIWQLNNNCKQTERMLVYYKSLFQGEDSGWQESRRALGEIISLCKKRNIPCYVVCFPVLYQLDDSYPLKKEEALIKEAVLEAGGEFVDLFEKFKGQDSRKLWVHPVDHHPNEAAHKIAARAIIEAMEDAVIARRDATP